MLYVDQVHTSYFCSFLMFLSIEDQVFIAFVCSLLFKIIRTCTWLLYVWCHCACVFTFLHVPLCVCLCTLHAQVSVDQYLQWCVLPAPSRCVNGLTHRIMIWVRAAGHVDMVDLLMVLTLLYMVPLGGALCFPQTVLHHDRRVMKEKVCSQVQVVPTPP